MTKKKEKEEDEGVQIAMVQYTIWMSRSDEGPIDISPQRTSRISSKGCKTESTDMQREQWTERMSHLWGIQA